MRHFTDRQTRHRNPLYSPAIPRYPLPSPSTVALSVHPPQGSGRGCVLIVYCFWRLTTPDPYLLIPPSGTFLPPFTPFHSHRSRIALHFWILATCCSGLLHILTTRNGPRNRFGTPERSDIIAHFCNLLYASSCVPFALSPPPTTTTTANGTTICVLTTRRSFARF